MSFGKSRERNDLVYYKLLNPLMPGGNKKVTHTFSCRFV